MSVKSLDQILEDFNPSETNPGVEFATLTLWVPAEVKARYDRIQELTKRRFGKKAKEILVAALEMAEKKVS